MKAPQEIAAEFIAIDSLKPNPRNVRKHPDSQVDGIAQTIKTLGFGRPLLVRKANMEIIAGHGAWLAARKLKMATVPCRVLDVTAAHAKKLAIADNRWAELSAWDAPMLDQELIEMTSADRLLVGYGEWKPEPAEPIGVDELDASQLDSARFVITVDGPMEEQLGILDKLRVALADIPTVRIKSGGSNDARSEGRAWK